MQWRRSDNLERRTLLCGDFALSELGLKGTETVRPERANLGGGYLMRRRRKLLDRLERVYPLRGGCEKRTDRRGEAESVRLMGAPLEEAAITLRKDSPFFRIINTKNVRSELAQNE